MYARVRISATSEDEADKISKFLVEKKLVAGTMIYSGKCHYWWDGKLTDRMYWNIGGFTLMKHKDEIIKEVLKIHSDKCPIIAFNEIDGNKEFLDWIDETV